MFGLRSLRAAAFSAAVLAPALQPAVAQSAFERGDVNDDGVIDIADAVRTLLVLFSGDGPIACQKSADINDDSKVDISDPVRLLGFLFLGSDPPPPPFGRCGGDPTPDALACGVNRCTGPDAACADLVAASIEFEGPDWSEFSTSITRVVATVRNDGPAPYTSDPGGALAVLVESRADGSESIVAAADILSLAPGQELTVAYDQEFSFASERAVALEIRFGSFARHDRDCDDANNLIGRTLQSILAGITQEGDCSPDLQRFNEDIMRYGRIAAVSRAFEECVATRVRSSYRKCIGDPWYNEDIETQIEKVLAACRSVNVVNIFCSGAAADSLASAGLGEYGHTGKEEFRWSGWIAGVYEETQRQMCTPSEAGVRQDCRYAPYPWPYSQAATVVWHEVLHTHGYTHGDNSQEPAIAACGYAGDRNWHFQRNTMPYIVGDCVQAVIELSEQVCAGGIDGCPGGNQLRLMDGWGSPVCECVNDPRQRGLGIVVAEGSQLRDLGILPDGANAGDWTYATSNAVRGSGDFDGDGRDEILLTSASGIAIIELDREFWRALVSRPNGRFGEWNFDSNVNKVAGIGDFNGDGRADILVTSVWGIGILTRSNSTLTSLLTKPNGSAFGAWRYSSATDEVRLGDFDGDGDADILVKRDDGIGVLTYSGGNLVSLAAATSGAWLGNWNFSGAENDVAEVGDLDGNGRTDIVVRSPTWIGALTLEGSALTSLAVKQHGTAFGAWVFDSAADAIIGVADLSGDGRDDLLVKNNAFIGVWSLLGGTFGAIVRRPNGSRFGDWRYNLDKDFITGIADVDADGAADILLRSEWGFGVVTIDGTSFRHIDMTPHDTLFGAWLVRETDWTVGLGDYDGQGGSDILFQAHDR
jgi:hypothetical protein